MPGFSFSTIEPNQLGQVSKWDVPLNDWVGITFGNAHRDTLGVALSRWSEDFWWGDEYPVPPDVLNRAYGIEGQLKFDKPISEHRARAMHERKRKELESLAYVESASHSWASAKAAVGFGASLVGGLSHPVDLGLAFLPFIGSEKAAAGVAKMGGGAFRQGLARGLIAEEAVALPGGRLTAAVIDGVVNQAIVEIPVAIQKHRDQAIYGLEDSAFNILAGGAFAGALKGLGLALERAGKLWRDADPRIREAALMDAAKTILTGESPRVHEYFGLDEATIRQKVEAKVRAENPFAEPDIPEDASVSTAKTTKLNREFREFPKGTEVQLTGNRVGFEGSEVEVRLPDGTTTGLPEQWLRNIVSRESLASIVSRLGRDEVERLLGQWDPDARLAPDGKSITTLSDPRNQTGKVRASSREFAGFVAEKEMEVEQVRVREQSINDFLAKAKADHEARLQGVIDHETRRVLDEIKTRTPQTPQADIDRYTVKGTPDDASIEAVNKDAADMAEQALNVARTPEERVALKAQIDKELAEVVTGEKAIDHMIPCVTQRAKV